ncbi:MAG: alpha-mannosidase, partial [Lachnospiraceae bacterium]|nr:alpha-mannosidase [Lachnospiraceae bacterium]
GWKHILTNQFHDIIPGSSIHEVYEDARKDYGLIEKIARNVEKDAHEAILEQKEHVYTVFNASGWELDQVVTVPETSDGIFRDSAGNVLVSQKGQGCTYVEVKKVPSLGTRTIVFESQKQDVPKAVFSVHGREIDTPFYQMTINQYGQIAKLFDKTYGRNVLPEGQRGNVLQVFEDKPLDNDAWDIDIFYQEKMREITELTVFEITEMGPLTMRIHMEWEYMNSNIRQDMILYSRSRRIDFCTNVDFHEQHQLLKAAFPVDIRATYGTYDVQYGNVRRPNHWNTSWDQAKFETVAHRWADLSERNYGVSLLNDCKYGHDIKDNVIRISLLRAGTQPDHLQDQGEHTFTYALLPHKGDFVEGAVVQEAFALNEPMETVSGKSLLPYESFLSFDNDQVELDAVKQSEDGKYLVLRFHEFAGSRQETSVKLGVPWKAWAEGDLRERPLCGFTGDGIHVTLHAYEIKTILVEIQ